MVKVELFSVCAEFVVAVEHQNILDHEAVGLSGIGVVSDFFGPGGRPVGNLQILILAVDQLGPTGLVQAEDQVAVLVLVGSLNGGGISGDDGVVIDGDIEAGFLGRVDQPGRPLAGIGVGINADGVVACGRCDRCQTEQQDSSQSDGQKFSHGLYLLVLFGESSLSPFGYIIKHIRQRDKS